MTPRRLAQVQLYARPIEQDRLRFLEAYEAALDAFNARLDRCGEMLDTLRSATSGLRARVPSPTTESAGEE